jgi:hypothetical protein
MVLCHYNFNLSIKTQETKDGKDNDYSNCKGNSKKLYQRKKKKKWKKLKGCML